MSLSVLLAQYHDVMVLDIDLKRVKKINNMKSTVVDKEIESFMLSKELFLNATTNKDTAYIESDFIIIATPTNYDEDLNFFDTSTVDQVVQDALTHNKNATIVIKSTIPVGHTDSLQKKYKTERVIFSPEFLREGCALRDNLYPSRIIVGSSSPEAKKFGNLLNLAAKKQNLSVIYTNSQEAEAIKLFANTYLAMRVAFFNELDSYALANDLNSEHIINGVSLDERIGGGYNNPSFGYGGYCLPKDTKQLLANFNEVPQSLIGAIVEANEIRKNYLAKKILEKNPTTVGFYRLVMKEGSDNFRSSSIQGIINRIKETGVQVIIYEPLITVDNFYGVEILNDLNSFTYSSDVIVANRMSDDLIDYKQKVFSRDIFGDN